MSAIAAGGRASPRPITRASAEVALVCIGLGAVVVVRAAATRAGLDPAITGAGFGLALLGLVVVGGERARIAAPRWTHVLAGTGTGLMLVAIVVAGASLGGSTLVTGLARPASPFVPWALVTILVAGAEEALLRGLLFDGVRRAGGTVVALLVTSAVFALVHVPLYGWHVVPLDLAVGLVLGGLRVATRGIAAPAVAHAAADLATWWL